MSRCFHYQAVANQDIIDGDECVLLLREGDRVILSSYSTDEEYTVTPDLGVNGLPFLWPKHAYSFGSLLLIPKEFIH